jgi:hypothetical protein
MIRSTLSGVLVSLVSLLFVSSATAVDVTLLWDAPADTDIAGYRIYWGATSRTTPGFGSYTNSLTIANTTTHTLNIPADSGLVYFAVTAFDFSNNESVYSNEASTTIGNDNRDDGPVAQRAILDFDGDVFSDTGLFTSAGLGQASEIFLSAGGTSTFTPSVNGMQPAFADYDGDGITDIAMVEKAATGLIWSVVESASGAQSSATFGARSDRFISGCHLDTDNRADKVVIKGKSINLSRTATAGEVKLPLVTRKRSSTGYCVDLDGDGIDEVVISGRLTEKQIDLLGKRGKKEFFVGVYNVNGQRLLKRTYRTMRELVAADVDGDGVESLGTFALNKGAVKFINLGGAGATSTFKQINKATPVTLDNGSGLRATGLLVQTPNGEVYQYDLIAGSETLLAIDGGSREIIREIVSGK